MNRSQLFPHDPGIDCAEASHDKLARGSDIEHARLESKAYGEAGEDNGCGVVEHLSHSSHTVGESSGENGEKSGQSLSGVAQDENHKSHQKSDENSEHRRKRT